MPASALREVPADQLAVPDTSVVAAYLTRGSIRSEFHHSLVEIERYDKAQGFGNYWGEVSRFSSVNIARARNDLVRQYLDDTTAEWALLVDDDMVLPPETLPRLLVAAQAAGARVIGALCVAVGDSGPIPTIYQYGNQAAGELTRMLFDYEDDVVTQVAASGTGCLLVHRSVFEEMAAGSPDRKFPWFYEYESESGGHWVGEDIGFTLRCNQMGVPVFVDCSTHVGHVKAGRTWWPADIRAGIGFPDEHNIVLIPTLDRFDLLGPLVAQLREQVDVHQLIVCDNGSDGDERLRELAEAHDVTVAGCRGEGLHEMWNRAAEYVEGRKQLRNVNVFLLNDDLRLGPGFVRKMADALRSERNLVAVSGNYDGRTGHGLVQPVADICAGRYDGTGGFAGFAFAVRGEWFLSGYRFPTECKWWYGDNDLLAAVASTGVGKVGIALEAHVEHLDGGSQTGGDWSDKAEQLDADRRAFEARWERIRATQARPETPEQHAAAVAAFHKHLCEQPSDINEHLQALVDLAVKLDAKTVIELGVRKGTSTISWLHAMDLTDGRLWSVDVDDPPAIPHPRWTFTQGSDLDPFVMGQLPPKADIVFIDTDHSYGQTAAELAGYGHRVRPGGCMVLHDSAVLSFDHHAGDEPPFPVRKAIKEFAGDYGLAVDWYEHNNGLAVIWMPGAEQ